MWASIGAVVTPGDGRSTLGAVMMVLLGIALALGPYYALLRTRIRSYRAAGDVHYVLTDRRAMILLIREGTVLDERIKALSHIKEPRLKLLYPSGAGDVVFDAGGAYHDGGDTSYSSHYDVGFEGIADAKQVFETFRRAINDQPRRNMG